MTVDDVQAMMETHDTLHERVAKRRSPVAITEISQHLGNRIVSHFYPEHWAEVQIARSIMHRWNADA